MERIWVIGDKRMGYTVKANGRKLREPWDSQIWNDGRIVRTDSHDTEADAIRYAMSRAREHGVRNKRDSKQHRN